MLTFCVAVAVFQFALLTFGGDRVEGFHKAKKLYQKLFETSQDRYKYNKYVRPVLNETTKIDVYIGLRLSQLIDVDEKNQYIAANVWMVYQWVDPTLQWEPKEFDDVRTLYVPAVSIWHPDIVLYNTADGIYETTNGTNAIITHTGHIEWGPPASFKVGCTIDVTYFPFDQQNCSFEFGSWTYNAHEIDIKHVSQKTHSVPADVIEVGIDLQDFYANVEWDLMSVPAYKMNFSYAGSETQFIKWRFEMILRRKFLFYTVNLIIPLISHAFITILVFYIPAASTEKMNLTINILLSLTVFFLMLAEIVPVTSIVVPLLGKYLLFTLMLVASSIVVTVLTYQVHFRSSSTHSMPDWTRKIFLYWLPKFLVMQRPKVENSQDVHLKYIRLRLCPCLSDGRTDSSGDDADQRLVDSGSWHSHTAAAAAVGPTQSRRQRTQTVLMNLSRELAEDMKAIRRMDLPIEVQKAIEGALFIANHLKKEDQRQRTKEDWKYVALVIDRVFLWLYGAICLFGTIAIICQAPMLYDDRRPITK